MAPYLQNNNFLGVLRNYIQNVNFSVFFKNYVVENYLYVLILNLYYFVLLRSMSEYIL